MIASRDLARPLAATLARFEMPTAEIDLATGVTREDFLEAMSAVPAAVHIVTSAGVRGRCGLTASAVLSVSDTPPTVLVSLNRSSVSAGRLLENGVFCVNTIGPDDAATAQTFAGRDGTDREARFANGPWRELVTGAPVLATARAAIDCRIVAVQQVATHDLVIGEVLAIGRGPSDGRALVYVARRFATVATRGDPAH